jgi:regulator of PEP synthase PpsR (kinase-PPPase family)
VREQRLHRATGDYAKPEHVAREMSYAMSLFSKHPKWAIVNVTSKPIEEIASEIITLSRAKMNKSENNSKTRS